MVRIERAWSAVCVAMMALAGCDSGAGAVPLEELEERAIEATCAFYFGCCTAAGRDALPDTVTTEAECIAYRSAQDWDLEEVVAAEVASGRYRYDASAAGACLAQVRSCQASDCQLAIGIVPEGGACEDPFECVSQLCESGVCTRRAARGEACTSWECDAGLICNAGVCMPRLADGGSCSSSAECASGLCSESGVCAPRDVCE